MTEREMTVCAIALFADGYSYERIARALGVSRDRAVELATAGAEAQSAGKMVYMPHQHPWGTRDDDDPIEGDS